MVTATKAQFPSFTACSFDKGFHSPENQQELKNIIDQVVLPKKSKLSKADEEREYTPEFRQAKKQHSAVESAINVYNGYSPHGPKSIIRMQDLGIKLNLSLLVG